MCPSTRRPRHRKRLLQNPMESKDSRAILPRVKLFEIQGPHVLLPQAVAFRDRGSVSRHSAGTEYFTARTIATRLDFLQLILIKLRNVLAGPRCQKRSWVRLKCLSLRQPFSMLLKLMVPEWLLHTPPTTKQNGETGCIRVRATKPPQPDV